MTDDLIRTCIASAQHAESLAALLEACSSGCYCRWWHFKGDKNEWLGRRVHTPELNREEAEERLSTGSIEQQGIVALRDERVIGWLKLAPSTSMSKLYAQRPFSSLHGATLPADILTIGCFVVDPDHRRRGVARALLRAAIDFGKGSGARTIEAFPYRAPQPTPELLWMGPVSLFEELGFSEVRATGPYSVLRLSL